jgi:hypothetical protein
MLPIKKCTDYNFNLKLKSNLKKISTLRHNNTFKFICCFFRKVNARDMNTNPLKNINQKIRTKIWTSFGFVSKAYLLEESIKYSQEQEKIFNEMIIENNAKDKKAKREAFDKALYATYKGIGAMDFINTVLK